jgi:hypothetical protein
MRHRTIVVQDVFKYSRAAIHFPNSLQQLSLDSIATSDRKALSCRKLLATGKSRHAMQGVRL